MDIHLTFTEEKVKAQEGNELTWVTQRVRGRVGRWLRCLRRYSTWMRACDLRGLAASILLGHLLEKAPAES